MTRVTRYWNEFRIAMMLLTRLPMGGFSGQVPSLSQARWAYPLVGLPIGLIVWAVWAGAGAIGFSPLVSGFLALAGLTFLTGGLHQDGLADLADGLGGGRDRDHCLEIMRDSRIGSYGVVALVMALGIWIFALFESRPVLTEFLAISVASRFAMLMVLEFLPPARTDGLGQSAATGGYRMIWVGFAAMVALLLPLGGTGLVVALAMVLTTSLVAWRAWKRIGGQTGDVCGATQLLAETAGWMALTL
jgi:adenosylcobinamide-GDP ribazoletransferase